MIKNLRDIIERELIFEETFERRTDGSHHAFHHDHEIGGHHVHVHFSLRGYPGKSYETHFAVNDTVNHAEGPRDPKINHHILHHVGRVVSSFIKEKKPQSLHFQAGDINRNNAQKKQRIYNHFAKSLARKHGGNYQEHHYRASSVSF